MASFQISGTAVLSTNCTSISITDTSNYSSATDLLQAWFTSYRYILVSGSSGFIYMYSSFNPNDGSNAYIPPPYPVITNTETWANTQGDGVYYIQIISVPTYEVALMASYTFLTNQFWYSTAQAGLYQCIQNNTTQPLTNTAYWTPVQQSSVVGSSVYTITIPVVSMCSINSCYANMVSSAICDFGGDGCGVGNLCQNPQLLNANQLNILLQDIATQLALSNYSQVQSDISVALAICGCGNNNSGNQSNCNC